MLRKSIKLRQRLCKGTRVWQVIRLNKRFIKKITGKSGSQRDLVPIQKTQVPAILSWPQEVQLSLFGIERIMHIQSFSATKAERYKPTPHPIYANRESKIYTGWIKSYITNKLRNLWTLQWQGGYCPFQDDFNECQIDLVA